MPDPPAPAVPGDDRARRPGFPTPLPASLKEAVAVRDARHEGTPSLEAARPNVRLLNHIAAQRDHLFTFLTLPGVDATNLRAEQGVRPAAVTTKVFGGTGPGPGPTPRRSFAASCGPAEPRALTLRRSSWTSCGCRGRWSRRFLSSWEGGRRAKQVRCYLTRVTRRASLPAIPAEGLGRGACHPPSIHCIGRRLGQRTVDMAIPDRQLETWSHQGATTTAKATHESIRRALNRHSWPTGVRFDVYLQGSYRNDTNIRGDSDVDIVAELTSAFRSDLSALPADQAAAQRAAYSSATYGWAGFRRDVLAALRNYYGGAAITEGKKAIRVEGGAGRLAADVVVCIKYRRYMRFQGIRDQTYAEGMTFYVPPEQRWVVNYPKIHYDNGVTKNSASHTKGWYKPTVRMFKNARSYSVAHGLLAAATAPSYFVECLLYNVPDAQFGGSWQQAFLGPLGWLWRTELSSFVCQNGQVRLFGSTPEQWSVESARTFLSTLVRLWNGWT